jgi:hypothetical protein
MKITVLGSCRQYSIRKDYHVTSIQENLSYPHYTKEMLEVIKYCKFNHLTPEQTKYTFRTPILNKCPDAYQKSYQKEFEETDLFVLEIASKLCYEYNGIYTHHIASEPEYNTSIKDDIKIRKQDDDEIENDILEIKSLLNKPILIVSHLVTYDKGERYNLAELLEKLCSKYNIPFINPIKEFKKRNISMDDLFHIEKVLAHYNQKGEEEIRKIYKETIDQILYFSL